MRSWPADTPDKKSANHPSVMKPARRGWTASDQRGLLSLKASGFGTWCWNVESDLIELDSRSKSLFGLPETEENITYRNLLLHLHPDDRHSAEEAILQFLATRIEYDVLHRVILPDKGLRWVRCKGRFAAGNSTEVLGLTIDVPCLELSNEEHVRTEERLRRSNRELERRICQRTAELEQTIAQVAEQANLLDLANDAIFIRGADDRVSYWNHGAERLYGWTREEAIGQSTHDLLRTVFPVPLQEILNSDRWEGVLIHAKRDGGTVTVASRWTTLRDSEKKTTGWLELNTDISARKASEQAAIRLSSRILKLQDEERRRLGRELHDSLGQSLTALKLSLDLMSIELGDEQRKRLHERLSECTEFANLCLKETRTLSHLLHPPLLDEAGLAAAARWYVGGFAKRTSLQVQTDISSDLPRLAVDAEIALYRVLQEGLTNVFRHSGCSAVDVAIECNGQEVMLKVRDNGRGMPSDSLRRFREGNAELGIGLAGMRERLRQLDGRLDINSGSEGTTVAAIVPISAERKEKEPVSHTTIMLSDFSDPYDSEDG